MKKLSILLCLIATVYNILYAESKAYEIFQEGTELLKKMEETRQETLQKLENLACKERKQRSHLVHRLVTFQEENTLTKKDIKRLKKIAQQNAVYPLELAASLCALGTRNFINKLLQQESATPEEITQAMQATQREIEKLEQADFNSVEHQQRSIFRCKVVLEFLQTLQSANPEREYTAREKALLQEYVAQLAAKLEPFAPKQ